MENPCCCVVLGTASLLYFICDTEHRNEVADESIRCFNNCNDCLYPCDDPKNPLPECTNCRYPCGDSSPDPWVGDWQDPHGKFYGGAIIRITSDSWHPVFSNPALDWPKKELVSNSKFTLEKTGERATTCNIFG